jgi:CBS domain-containing protein
MATAWFPKLFKGKEEERKEVENKKEEPATRIIKLKKLREEKKKKHKIQTKILVSDIMTKSVVSVLISSTLEDVVETLLSNNITGVSVFENDMFVGVISRTDILNLVKKQKLDELTEEDMLILGKNKVEDFIKRPICIRDNRDIDEARKKMEKYNIKRLFVLDNANRLVGIITMTDLLKGFSRERIQKKVYTKIDDILKLLQEGPTDFEKISKSLDIPENLIEEWAKILEEHDLIEIDYPPMGSPVLKLKGAKTS